MKTLCLVILGGVLLAGPAWSADCPSNFPDNLSGRLKEVNPKRPLFKLMKNDVRDGYEPGQELTLSLHSLVKSRPMSGYVVTAKSIDKKCGEGRMVALKGSSATVRPGCPHAIESNGREAGFVQEEVFGFRAPKCGCVIIKATVIAAMHEIAYVDAARVYEGPLTMTLCPSPAAVKTFTKSKLPSPVAEYVPKTQATGKFPVKDGSAVKNTVGPKAVVKDVYVDDIDDESDEDDEEFYEDEDVDDIDDDVEDDVDDIDDESIEDDDVIYDDDEDEEEDDETDEPVDDSYDVFDSEEDEEDIEEGEEFVDPKKPIRPMGRRPWRRRPFVGPRGRPGRFGHRMPHRRPHVQHGSRRMPQRGPFGRMIPQWKRRPGPPPKAPLAARVHNRFKGLQKPLGKPVPQRSRKNGPPKFHPKQPLQQIRRLYQRRPQAKRFGLLNGRGNPLGMVRHHVMGPNNFLIDRLCTIIEKVHDGAKGDASMNEMPFQMPHFFGCPNATGHEKSTFRKRGPPGLLKDQAKRRLGDFDNAEIKKRWEQTQQHTKMCCGKTGDARYACIRRQRMDVVCAPDFKVPLCASPSTILVRWKIAEARDKCCPHKGVDRYDCFNKTTHPIAGHPVVNHRMEVEETTPAPSTKPTEVPSVKQGPVDSAEDSFEEDQEDEGWLEDAFDEGPNQGPTGYKPKQPQQPEEEELEAELAGTLGDTDEDRQMKKTFIEEIARPVWQKGGLIQRLRDLAEEAEEILDEEDDEDLIGEAEDILDEDEKMHMDDEELDDIEDALNEEESRRRRPGRPRPRRRNVLKRCCWAGKRAARNITQRWSTCVAKSKPIGNRLHGLVRRKCKAVFRRCCVKAPRDVISKKDEVIEDIAEAVKPIQPVIPAKYPKHVVEEVKKQIKKEWKPQIFKPRIRILDEPEEDMKDFEQ